MRTPWPIGFDLGRFSDALTPALVIRLDAVRRNLLRMIAAAGGCDRLRMHVKSAKLRVVFDEAIAAGITNYKCATTREAECLLDACDAAGIEGDLLVAYPHRGANLRRIVDIARAHPSSRVSVLIEDTGNLDHDLDAFVDVNAGMHRTGIPVDRSELVLACAQAAGERFRGIHYYEGHVHTGTFAERCQQAKPLLDRLVSLVGFLEDRGLDVREVITSGTPSLMPALAHPGLAGLERTVHRVSPGTLVYFDARSAECEELDYEFAAFVLGTVVSHPAPGIVTVDAGSKALAAEAGSPVAIAPDWPGLAARTPSEEHLPFDVVSGTVPTRGTLLALVPRHVCPTVNLAEAAWIVDDERAPDTLRVADVTARAHELHEGNR
ncbi:MAG: alanine racemase [Planctomycetes bacterium]|nr:alanine racemase [Planctomycetota bacterium]